MSLSSKIIYKIVGLLVGLAALSGMSLWGLAGMQDDVRAARDEYRDLRALQGAILHAATARIGRELVNGGEDVVLDELEARDDEIDSFVDALITRRESDNTPGETDPSAIRSAVTGLRGALEGLHNSNGDYAAAVRSFADVLAHLDELAGKLDSLIAEAQHEADNRLHFTMLAIAVVSLLIIAAITWLNLSNYRSVITPLRRLHEGVSRIASGQFHDRLPLTGASEFQLLSSDFNRMAEQLEEMYIGLEQKVEAKSRALVRSERLASVGYLAAGVAHEINNPLNIMSGHAELTLKRLERGGRTPESDETAKSLATIRDEAFRCKDITEKLLSLSRSGESPRERVSVRRIASDVATMVSCLLQYRDRRVTVAIGSEDDLPVLGNANELKQVLLNLTLNALQAVEPERGAVVLEGESTNGFVNLRVRDNGRGMTPETIEKVFEPFYTNRRGSVGHGIGLGLSISHAIIESHGGKITAESAGTGKGSCFTIELSRWDG